MHIRSLPYVESFEDLRGVRESFADSIVVAIDFENIDHNIPNATPMTRLSEVGVAYLDMRTRGRNTAAVNTSKMARAINVKHGIVKKWQWVTEQTCPVHRGRTLGKWSHTATPYCSQFTKSALFDSADDAMTQTFSLLERLKTSNRTPAEITQHRERHVVVLFWAAFLETRTFSAAGLSARLKAEENIHFFDLQRWAPIERRWQRQGKSQAPCGDAMLSLGVAGVELHNAANDAFAEVLGMARFLTMSEAEYKEWEEGGYLEAIDMSWVDGKILAWNKSLAPAPRPRNRRGPKKREDYIPVL